MLISKDLESDGGSPIDVVVEPRNPLSYMSSPTAESTTGKGTKYESSSGRPRGTEAQNWDKFCKRFGSVCTALFLFIGGWVSS